MNENINVSYARIQDEARVPIGPDPISYPNKIRKIIISELNKGYIVEVGCHSFAISEKEELLSKLIKYINEPTKTENEWFSGNLFK